MLKVVHDEAEPNEASGSVLDEIVREAARQMLAVALQAEVSAYIDARAEEVDENGHRLVVRNGHHNEREVITAAGPVPVLAPRVNDKRTDPATRERKRFASAILPAWARKSPRLALDDGHRESTESWLDLLRGCKRRGMAAPMLAVGDGALGFWSAVREVFPETREQRCWWHKIGNVLNALPKSAQPGAKKALAEIWNAEDKDHAQAAANVFAADYGEVAQGGRQDRRGPRRAVRLRRLPRRALDPPATTNPIESTSPP
jgi:transposase-like protein